MTGEENDDAVFEGAQTTYIVNSVVSGNVNGPIMQIGRVGGVVSVPPEGEDD
ncbi:hypothetical protein [Lentzea aerocolonigenes]|uniref:hypothetical protein n=1 Tax=Lentzea aerocolonigenes TaxID=68170 RepID=UPI000A653FBC|nr:hypothetical protein [Lentzea aerocolonigenes]